MGSEMCIRDSGGIVLGTRVVAQSGVPEPLVMASLIADITLELVAQLVFTPFGFAILLMVMVPGRDTHLLTIIAIGLGISALGLGLLIIAQKPLLAFSGTLSARLLPAAAEAVKAVPGFLDQIYAAPVRGLSPVLRCTLSRGLRRGRGRGLCSGSADNK